MVLQLEINKPLFAKKNDHGGMKAVWDTGSVMQHLNKNTLENILLGRIIARLEQLISMGATDNVSG